MPGLQGYIYQKNNRLVNAVIDANVSPSAKPPLIYPVLKRGNGNIRLYGNYSGAVDARYDVKILDSVLENPVVSSPTFRGAGTGKISDIVASGLEAQKIQVTCLSTGTDTKNAEIELEGLRFRVKQGGSTGNNIYLIIDDSQLIFTKTDFSTVKSLKVNDTGLEGQEWDWDTKTIQGNNVPPDAHRIAFGQDRLHIYLQYKKFEDGRWKYYFIMPIKYDVKAGSTVYFVSGGRKVIVTNGTTIEEYTDIVTIADLWQKVKNSSTLIEPIDSSIDTSRNITSPAVREFATKTDAYFLPPYRSDKSSEYAGELESINITNNAKTELIEIKCIDNTYVGAEIWDVKGSSSGDLGQAKTGEYADFGYIGFTIPQKFPEGWGKPKEDWSYKIRYASRSTGETLPPICFSMRLGINSYPQSLELEYKKKPPECECPSVSFSDICLGFEEKGGEIGMAYTVPDMIFWIDAVFERMAEKFAEGSFEAEVYERAFNAATKDYVSRLKQIGQRMMNLPEDDPATLQIMVDELKALTNSLKVVTYLGNFPYASITSTWDGSNWFPAAYDSIADIQYDTDLYQTLVDRILLYERTYGVKKNRIIAAGTCYIDAGGDYYWEVRGGKAYLPAFTDTPYYSTVKSGDDYVNTKEFAFLISTPCYGTLKEGDTIQVTIGGIKLERTYQIGDITYLPTVAAQNLRFTGGVDGDDTYIFEVRGEINSFPDYHLNRNNPQRYYHPNLSFQIEDGIIPFAIGDAFEFSIEGGRFIWRKDNGSWSSPLPVKKEIQPFDSGLQIGFDFGVSPSFMQDDSWEVLCVQENRTSNLTTPWKQTWKGTGSLTFSFASQVTIDTLIIDMHDLTGTVTFKASNISDFSTLVYSEVITVTDLICKLYISSPITAQFFKLELSGEHKIGYIFLGSIMQLSLDADGIRPMNRYQISRQETKTPFSLINYIKSGYIVEYKSFILNDDYEMLDEMINYLKSNNDMPFYFVGNINYPDECIRAYIDTDNIEVGSDIDINAPKASRLYSLTLPIVGVK